MRTALSVLSVFCAIAGSAACGDPAPSEKPPQTPADKAAPGGPVGEFPVDGPSWGRFHSKRFFLSFSLPDGRAWKIDDHSRPTLFALHEPTSSKLWVAATHEQGLMNRQRCEQRARDQGLVPKAPLTTVEDEVTTGPDAYDSRVWVAVDASQPGGGLEGHVFLFGGFLRQCLVVHVQMRVPSAKDEDVLASRLALARARIVRGITLDPPRTTDDASVPRDRPDMRRPQ